MDVVTSYVSFCIYTVIPVKKSNVFPKNKTSKESIERKEKGLFSGRFS